MLRQNEIADQAPRGRRLRQAEMAVAEGVEHIVGCARGR